MIVSFDFDGVLSRPAWQVVAALHAHEGDEVYVLSARCPEQADRLYQVADLLDIPRDRVLLTCNRPKWESVAEAGIELHFDDNAEELAQIRELTDAVTVDINSTEAVDYVAGGQYEDLQDDQLDVN